MSPGQPSPAPDAGVLQNKQSLAVVSASSSGSGTFCHFLHRQEVTPRVLTIQSVGSTSHYHSNYPTEILPTVRCPEFLHDLMSGMFRTSPPPPTPAHLMVKLKRSWWFNLKQSRINSKLLAAHQAVWPSQTLCIVVQMLLLILRLSLPSSPQLGDIWSILQDQQPHHNTGVIITRLPEHYFI